MYLYIYVYMYMYMYIHVYPSCSPAEYAGLVASLGSAAAGEALTCPTCNKAQLSIMIGNRP